jgi:hypothetical protein
MFFCCNSFIGKAAEVRVGASAQAVMVSATAVKLSIDPEHTKADA